MIDLIATRVSFGKELVRLGHEIENFVVMDADIAKSCSTDLFHKQFPERSYNFGIAEQNLFSAAAGFASTGSKVFAATYAVFASMRACEQIRTFICYPKLDVKVIASHGGLQVGPDGATHQAIEDVSIMRALPNMTVVQPSDGTSARLLARAVMEHTGPMYIRLLRNPSPILFGDEYKFEIGKANKIKDYGDDVSIIATGAMLIKAMEAAEVLLTIGIKSKVIEIHTIKPIDKQAIISAAKQTGAIVTVEDHSIFGGLGSAVSEVVGESHPVPIKMIGVPDIFGESGESESLYNEYGMSTKDIVTACKEIINNKKYILY